MGTMPASLSWFVSSDMLYGVGKYGHVGKYGRTYGHVGMYACIAQLVLLE